MTTETTAAVSTNTSATSDTESSKPRTPPPSSDFSRAAAKKKRQVLAALVVFVALAGGGRAFYEYKADADNVALEQQVIADAKAGKTAAGEKAMRTTAKFWRKHEYSASEYLDLVKENKLLLVGIPDAKSFRAISPQILVLTTAGDMGFVEDTWWGGLTERTMADRAKNLTVITVGPAADRESGSSVFPDILGTLLPEILFIAIILFVLRGGGRRFVPVRNVTTRFSDVIGATEAKQALQDVVSYLRNPEAYHRVGARPNRGVLLYGPPGTGKTLLAKALAGECGVSFIACSGADFSSKFYGVGISTVKNLFQRARREGACILFIDEIDGVGRRSEADTPGVQEGNRIINQLLIEMDGFAEDTRVVVIGATNRPEQVDSALRREGRFDRKIGLRLPEVRQREELLKLYSERLTVDQGLDFEQLARMSTGLSPAAIAATVNQAALIAARAEAKSVTMAHMAEALDTAHLGEANGKTLTTDERHRTAIHEAGHAIMAKLRNSGTVEKVTILPRGDALGVTFVSQDESLHMRTKEELVNQIKVLLAGRCAEELLLGSCSSGASNDLERATQIITDMVTRLGFGVGLAVLTNEQRQSRETLDYINTQLNTYYKDTVVLLKKNESALRAVVDELLAVETITGARIRELVEKPPRTAELVEAA